MPHVRGLVLGLVACAVLAAPAEVRARSTSDSRIANATLDTSMRLQVEGGQRRTARALRAGIAAHQLARHGRTWLGRMHGNARGLRDVLIFVPDGLDRSRPIELVIYMEGFGAFSDQAMKDRHAAGIAKRLARDSNFIYVSPDVPSSAHHGSPRHKGLFWRRDDPQRPASPNMPGDFERFYIDVLGKIAPMVGGNAIVETSLIGFSRGGLGLRSALDQLATSTSTMTLQSIALTRVVFADAFYADSWLTRSWDHLRKVASLRELSFLVPKNHARSTLRLRSFLHAALKARVPPGQRHWNRDALHVHTIKASHNAIGDLAVHYLPPRTITAAR